MKTRPNIYAGSGLDRAGLRRKDPVWLAARRQDPSSRFVPVWQGLHLISSGAAGPRLAALPADQVPAAAETVLLGLREGVAWFTWRAVEPPAILPDGASFQELRGLGALLPLEEAGLLGYARAMLHWHETHRFCGRCGAATEVIEGGHVRRCTAPDCAGLHFPRTDPAVIMLVTDGDSCLLARQARFPAGMMSTLAGFVEPGESLEEAVQREVLEEVGIETGTPLYYGSQPWPFPGSLMLGFEVPARSRLIRLDPAEIEDAQWFSRQTLLDLPPGAGLSLPRPDSIARRLVDRWLLS